MALYTLQGSCRLESGSFVGVQRRLPSPTEPPWSHFTSINLGCDMSVCTVGGQRTLGRCFATDHLSIACKASNGPYQPCSSAFQSNGGAAQYSFAIPHGFTVKPGFSQEFGKGLSCKCSNSFGELGSAAILEWKPALDNLLLVSSIALAYIAGIITPATPAPSVPIKGPTCSGVEEFQALPNVQGERVEETPLWKEDIWNGARSKLIKSIDAADAMCDEIYGQGVQLSLQALARGPRLRLLLVALEQLEKEICNLQQHRSSLESNWSKISVQMLCESVVPVCRTWACEEHLRSVNGKSTSKEGLFVTVLGSLVSKEHTFKSSEMVAGEGLLSQWNLFESYSESNEGNKIVTGNLKVTGKAEFYADFLYFICSGHVRVRSSCNLETLQKHKNSVLEDLVIFVADGASALYLDLISAGNPTCESEWLNVMAPSISSTRMLERFRNEVALNSWLNENFQSVTAMFEDRFDLWILKSCTFEMNETRRSSSKKRSKNRMASLESRESLNFVIEKFKLPVRRVRELRALSGWRYYYSLFLEFSDICGPLLRTVVTKLGEGISFLLVILIGRSLGLIYRGICQSVQWTSK